MISAKEMLGPLLRDVAREPEFNNEKTPPTRTEEDDQLYELQVLALELSRFCLDARKQGLKRALERASW